MLWEQITHLFLLLSGKEKGSVADLKDGSWTDKLFSLISLPFFLFQQTVSIILFSAENNYLNIYICVFISSILLLALINYVRSAAEAGVLPVKESCQLVCMAPSLGQGGLFLWDTVARQGQRLMAGPLPAAHSAVGVCSHVQGTG